MERYETLFKQLKERKEGAFVPFVTLGDPSPEQSLKIIDTLIEAGADALELGIPFSDPLADGPTIQNATLRAFAAGVTPSQCFEMLAAIRQKHPTIPIGLLMYANLVFSRGIDEFYAQCEKAGVDSVLVADVPCLRRSVRPRCGIMSRRSSSARQTPMTSCCVKSPRTVAVIPICSPVPGLPGRKTVPRCRSTIWSKN
jgi:tryptophan synthase alpha subunit